MPVQVHSMYTPAPRPPKSLQRALSRENRPGADTPDMHTDPAPSAWGATVDIAVSRRRTTGITTAKDIGSPRNTVQTYRDKLVAVFSQHNPAKLGEVDSLMAKHVGQERSLFLKICAKYHVAPDTVLTGAEPDGVEFTDEQARDNAAKLGIRLLSFGQ